LRSLGVKKGDRVVIYMPMSIEGVVAVITADIGWVTGHSYVAYGPLAVGVTQLIKRECPQKSRYLMSNCSRNKISEISDHTTGRLSIIARWTLILSSLR
jgi:acyl-coenzyme A synthetase/AMP-(fatty) acid ligase